jgi:hypothetical protein
LVENKNHESEELAVEDADVLILISRDIKDLERKGRKSIEIEQLLELLEQKRKHIPSISQLAEFNNREKIAYADREFTTNIELFKAVVETAKTALKTALLINGGACIALLAFISNLAAKADLLSRAAKFSNPMSYFAIGVLVAAVATGCAYMTQSSYAHFANKRSSGKIVSAVHRLFDARGGLISIILVIASYGFFGLGIAMTFRALNG